MKDSEKLEIMLPTLKKVALISHIGTSRPRPAKNFEFRASHVSKEHVMPRKTKTSQAADRELRTLPEDLIERALGAELGHHLGYPSGAANQRWQ